MRIQKFLAQLGHGSRRGIEELIHEGRVSVNNVPAHIGQVITGHERIMIDDQLLSIIVPLPKLLLYYKPVGEIFSRVDNNQKGTCFDRFPETVGRWQSVGRLDVATSGLLLMSTSGEWVHYLTHPKNALERTYWVKVTGLLTQSQLQSLKRGLKLEDGAACITHYDHIIVSEGYSTCEVTVQEGRNKLVRRLFAQLGMEVQKLKRLRYGPFTLPSHLKPGSYVEADIRLLRWLNDAVLTHNK